MEKTITFQRLPRMTGAARRSLTPICYGHDFSHEIRRGICELWQVEPVRLFLITRIEKKELVICAAAGRDLVSACIYLLAAARQQGLTSIRYHTRKPAFARLIQKQFPDFRLIETRQDEFIYRMVIHGRR